MKLKAVYAYKGKVTLITGLAIRGAGSELSIGGADSEVIKNPITGEPYIPGSSLKGKMRSQLERVYGAKNKKGEIELAKPCGCGQCEDHHDLRLRARGAGRQGARGGPDRDNGFRPCIGQRVCGSGGGDNGFRRPAYLLRCA